MSYILSQLTACPTIQADLRRYFAICPVNEFMPFMEFLGSGINNRGLQQEISPGRGKVRKVQLVYTPRLLESTVAENQPNPVCTGGDFVGDNQVEYDIDTSENFQWKESFTPEDLERACIDNGDYFVSRIMAGMDVLDRRLATERTTDLASLIGTWASNVTANASNEFEVATVAPGTAVTPQTFNVFTAEKIDLALQKTGFCNETFIFAGTQLSEYYRAVLAGCCSNQGIDVSGIFNRYGRAIAYDRRVESTFGADKGVVVQGGALALLYFTRANWKAGFPLPYQNNGNYIYTVVVSPRTGVPMDLTIKDDCGVITVVLTATTKLVGLPNDMYRQGDFMEGVNYVTKLKVVNT